MVVWQEFFCGNSSLSLLITVAITSSLLTYLILHLFHSKNDFKTFSNLIKYPKWYDDALKSKDMRLLHVDEWKNKHGVYRQKNGWHGADYMHSPSSHVRIFDYLLSLSHPDTSIQTDTYITSIVSFTSSAESHKGLCHGGTMCAVMDDVIGWTGFCESGTCMPWSGYTVQVDTALKKPIHIGSILRVEGWIEKREGKRKIHIRAKLTDEHGEVHAIGTGLFLKK